MGSAIETAAGTLEGVSEAGARVFRGVPYAAPPVGRLRFRPPAPPERWAGVRAAAGFGPIAPQPPSALGSSFGAPPRPHSEDCLTLNVWTPAPGGRRPVLVWIHGGGFETGSGSEPMYDGASLALRGDVVVVTLNYRLGALGFLAHPGLADPESGAVGNWGLLDQIAGLEWVRDNISAFGGDPDDVTIFGESAGGVSVGVLVASPRASGLFRRAVVQSGAPWPVPFDQGLEATGVLCDALGLDAGDVAKLRDVPVERLQEMQPRWAEVCRRGRLAVRPTIDGGVIPDDPLVTLAAGVSRGVDLMVGTNRDEIQLFALADPGQRDLDEAAILRRLERSLGSAARARTTLEVYRTARVARAESVTPTSLWCAIETDRLIRAPLLRFADAHHAAGGRAHAYLFDWESPMLGGALGSCHALEVPFVFGTLERRGIRDFTGSGPEAQRLSARMQDAWLAFARTGSPGTPELGEWPTYDPERRATMILGAACGVEPAPRDPERSHWQDRS